MKNVIKTILIAAVIGSFAFGCNSSIYFEGNDTGWLKQQGITQ